MVIALLISPMKAKADGQMNTDGNGNITWTISGTRSGSLKYFTYGWNLTLYQVAEDGSYINLANQDFYEGTDYGSPNIQCDDGVNEYDTYYMSVNTVRNRFLNNGHDIFNGNTMIVANPINEVFQYDGGSRNILDNNNGNGFRGAQFDSCGYQWNIPEDNFNWYVYWDYNYITYNGNGSTSGSMGMSSVAQGSSYSILDNQYYRTGYAFLGWNTDQNAANNGTVQYKPNSNFTVASNTTLYAVWSGADEFVNYFGNGQTAGTDYFQSYYDIGKNTLARNTFTKTSYAFSNWTINGTDYSCGSNIINTSGSTSITAMINTSFAVDTNGASSADGTNIQLWSSCGGVAQKYCFQYAKTENGVSYWVIRNTLYGKVLDIENGHMADGTNVRLWTDNGSDAQLWTLVPAGNGSFYIKSKGNTNYVLDLSGGNINNGTNIQIWSYNGSNAQKWYLDGVTYNAYAKWEGTDEILYYYGNGATDNPDYKIVTTYVPTPIKYTNNIFNRDGYNFTKWTSLANGGTDRKVGSVADQTSGFTQIESARDLNKAVDNDALNEVNGNKVQIWDNNGSDNEAQQWAFIYRGMVNNTPYWSIQNKNNGKCLDADAGNYGNGDHVILWEYSGGDNQQWTIEACGDGYYFIKNKAGNFYLDLPGGDTTNGTKIQIWEPNGSTAQKWKLPGITVNNYAQWEPAYTNVTINHYVMDVNGNYPITPTESEDQDFMMGTTVTISDLQDTSLEMQGVNFDYGMVVGGTKATTVQITDSVKQINLYYNRQTQNNQNVTINHYAMDVNGNYPSTPTVTEEKNFRVGTTVTVADLKDNTLEVSSGVSYVYGRVGGVMVTTVQISGSVKEIDLYYERQTQNVTINHYVMDVNGNYPSAPTETAEEDFNIGSTITISDLKDTSLEVSQGVGYAYGMVEGIKATTVEIEDSTNHIDLYYIRQKHNVTYDAVTNGGKMLDGSSTKIMSLYYGAQIDLTGYSGTKDGWSFVGWNTDSTATTKTQSLQMNTTDITIYGIYSKTITESFIDSAGTHKVSTVIYNKATSGKIDAPSITAYEDWKNVSNVTSVGWSTASKLTADTTVTCNLTSGQTGIVVTTNQTYYAIYSATATLIYNLNGGQGSIPEQSSAVIYKSAADLTVVGGKSVTLAISQKYDTKTDGYTHIFTLGAWAENATAGKQYAPNGSYVLTGNTTMFAIWNETNNPITYTVKFNSNGGTGQMQDMSMTYDQAAELTKCIYKKSTANGDSLFIGWSTDPNTKNAIYKDQDNVKNLTSQQGGIVTLYAIWDDCPDVTAVDRYYTLADAQNGIITVNDLLSSASATDDIDKLGDKLKLDIRDYSATDFTTLTADAQITISYRATDSRNNKAYKMVTVYIVDTTAQVIQPDSYVRSISEKYYKSDPDQGGLETDSIWRSDSSYAAVLNTAMINRGSLTQETGSVNALGQSFAYTKAGSASRDHTYQTWEFTQDDIKTVKSYVDDHGIGNIKEATALQGFTEQFAGCKK